MKKLLFAMLMVLLGGGMALAGQPDPDPKPAPDPAAPDADTPAVAKAKDTLATEMSALKKAEKEAKDAAEKELAAIEEAQAIKEVQAQTELVRALRKAAEYKKTESELRAKRAVQPPPEPDKKKTVKIQEILDLIAKN